MDKYNIMKLNLISSIRHVLINPSNNYLKDLAWYHKWYPLDVLGYLNRWESISHVVSHPVLCIIFHLYIYILTMISFSKINSIPLKINLTDIIAHSIHGHASCNITVSLNLVMLFSKVLAPARQFCILLMWSHFDSPHSFCRCSYSYFGSFKTSAQVTRVTIILGEIFMIIRISSTNIDEIFKTYISLNSSCLKTWLDTLIVKITWVQYELRPKLCLHQSWRPYRQPWLMQTNFGHPVLCTPISHCIEIFLFQRSGLQIYLVSLKISGWDIIRFLSLKENMTGLVWGY